MDPGRPVGPTGVAVDRADRRGQLPIVDLPTRRAGTVGIEGGPGDLTPSCHAGDATDHPHPRRPDRGQAVARSRGWTTLGAIVLVLPALLVSGASSAAAVPTTAGTADATQAPPPFRDYLAGTDNAVSVPSADQVVTVGAAECSKAVSQRTGRWLCFTNAPPPVGVTQGVSSARAAAGLSTQAAATTGYCVVAGCYWAL